MPATYAVGNTVGESGFYVCTPCGYRRYLARGTRFPSCLQCFPSGQWYQRGLERWERITRQARKAVRMAG